MVLTTPETSEAVGVIMESIMLCEKSKRSYISTHVIFKNEPYQQ